MKVNKKLLPIKAHYFCFFGSVSPIIPFILIIAVHLGVPLSVQGPLSACALLLPILAKPLLAALADSFPEYRKIIFLLILIIMVGSFCSISFISPMQEAPTLSGKLVMASDTLFGGGEDNGEIAYIEKPYLLAQDEGGCYVSRAWDCKEVCSHPWACLKGHKFSSDVKVTALEDDLGLQVVPLGNQEKIDGVLERYNLNASIRNDSFPWNGASAYGLASSILPHGRLYQLEGINMSWDLVMANVSLECVGGNWSGVTCSPIWSYWQFWVYVILLMVGQIAFDTVNSITDAIVVDSIDEEDDYGPHLAWGVIGWGLMGPISGFLVDWCSYDSINKDYTPAFVICFLLGFSSIHITAYFLKVPEIKTEQNLLKNLGPLLWQPRFLIFCFFTIMCGAFDGITDNYLFMMQEDMAKGSKTITYISLIQGFTLFLECASELPFMFGFSWFAKCIGTEKVISLVLFLFTIRFLALSATGAYGFILGTILVELLNGPCFGLGYTSIVVHAAKLAPPGTSNTVQSIIDICYENLGFALAMFVGGKLYPVLGGPRLYLVAGITTCVVFVLHLLSLKFLPLAEEDGGDEAKTG